MKTNMFKLLTVTASVAVAGLLASNLSASAQGYGPMAHRGHHHVRPMAHHAAPVMHSARQDDGRYHRVANVEGYRPLTVNGAVAAAPVYAAPVYVPGPVVVPAPAPVVASGYSPFAGPGAVVTGPIAIGATLASLPFRLINAIFPADAHDPRAVVGAPIHAAGRIVQAPFAIAQAPFGGPGPFQDGY